MILHGAGSLFWTSVLNLALPPLWPSPDAWLEHQKPVLHTAQNKREKRKEKKEGKKERKKEKKERKKERKKEDKKIK